MDTFFNQYQESPEPVFMNKFIASAYLPFGQRFEEHIINANHEWVSKLDLVTQEAIIINFNLIRSWLSVAYPLLFNTSDQDSEANEKNRKNRPADSQFWIKVLDNIIGDDIVYHDNYANLPVHNVFRYMTNSLKKS